MQAREVGLKRGEVGVEKGVRVRVSEIFHLDIREEAFWGNGSLNRGR